MKILNRYFHLPNQLQIRRNEQGVIDQIMPVYYQTVKEHYV
jgi:hypothetical protein